MHVMEYTYTSFKPRGVSDSLYPQFSLFSLPPSFKSFKGSSVAPESDACWCDCTSLCSLFLMSQPAADRPRDGIRVVKNPMTPLGFKEVMIMTYRTTISMMAPNIVRSMHIPTMNMTDCLPADLDSLLLVVVSSIKEVNDTRKNNNEMYNIVIVNVVDTFTNNK